MPCGGIYPVKGSWVESLEKDETKPNHRCFVCGEAGTTHFCDEWDCFIHAKCVPKFLQSDEGLCVITHGHVVYIDFSQEKEQEKEV